MGSGGSEAGVGGDSQRERGRQRQRQRLMRRGGGQGGRWGRGGGWGRTRGDWASTVAWWSGDSGVGREVSKAHEAPGGGEGDDWIRMGWRQTIDRLGISTRASLDGFRQTNAS